MLAFRVLGRERGGRIAVADLDAAGALVGRESVDEAALPGVIGATPDVRWVWSDTAHWYPAVLRAGIRVGRCHDLRLVHAVLQASALVTDAAELRAAVAWDAPSEELAVAAPDTLFELESAPRGVPHGLADALAEFDRQRAVLAAAPGSLRLLSSAESAGALAAAEMHAAGLPWDAAVHDGILEKELGPRPPDGALPARMRDTADRVRAALDDPQLSLDSQPRLLRALHRAGILVASTSKWQLAEHDHPAIEPLLQYKRMARLLSANGWHWRETWAPDGRFRPVYVPGGVVTGRWASSGGGALQMPRGLRPAAHADPGWAFVIADVAQLEPRVLAAMSRDTALADAARGRDLYEGITESGVVATRQDAKLALLGAMYGATSGDGGRLVPSLRRAYPRAMGLVDAAARAGEEGAVVTTWLGRSSPPPSPRWHELQARAGAAEATPQDREHALRAARDRGRFTRNFVVQGTAAEWALAWIADLRVRLAGLPEVPETDAALRSGPVFSRRAHLAFFLHDEIIVHAPCVQADAAADAVRAAAESATHRLFGDVPIEFPLDLHIRPDAAKG